MSKATKAGVKDGRLTIATNNARQPGVVSLGLDQVSNGQFETAPAENAGTALVFKPAGKKTGETIAIYNSPAEAAKALGNVYKALSGGKSKGGFWTGALKILGITAVILVVLAVAASSFMAWLIDDAAQQIISDIDQPAPPAIVENGGGPATPAAPTMDSLPVGEAFPARDYIRATQDAAANNEGM